MFEKNPSTKNIMNFIVRITAIVFLLAVAQFAQGEGAAFAQDDPQQAAPSVTTIVATSVTSATATLNSFVKPNGSATTAWFRYSTSNPGICNDSFGNRVPTGGGTPLGSGSSEVSYSYPVSGLTPGEVYYFCAIAENGLGKAYGSVLSFTTPPPLTVTTTAATQVTSATATLNSFVNPNGSATTAWFRYSTTDPIICYDVFGTRVPASGGTPLGSGSSDVSYSYPISGLTPGEVYYFCAIAENGLGKAYGSVLSFTTPPSPDNTHPVTTIILDPDVPNGSNGWYTSDVHVTVSASDGVGGSGVTETRCALDPVSVPATFDDLPNGCSFSGAGADVASERAHTIYAASKDNAGNKEHPKSQTFKLDSSKPSASLSAAGVLGNGGWYIGDVTITSSGTDSVSNPVICTPVQFQITDTAGVAFNGSCTNDAGLSMNAEPITIKRDAVAPVVTVTGVTNDATYSLGAVPVAGCSTTDATSGVAASPVLSLSGGPVGSVIATCSGAEDNAGNFGQASVTFNVAYNWAGFFQPVDNLPTLNLVSAGRAIPVKFSLGGDQGLNIFAAGYPKSEPIACNSSTPVDGVETTLTVGSSSLSYDPSTDQYIFVWKTEKSWAGTCRQLIVKWMDGIFHRANFKFK